MQQRDIYHLLLIYLKLAPYELPQVIAHIPPAPMDVPIPVRKASMMEGENKVVNYLLHGEYELNKTSWSKLQKKYDVSRNKIYAALKGKKDLEAPNIDKRRNRKLNKKPQLQCPILKLSMIQMLIIKLINIILIYFRYTDHHGITCFIQIHNVQCSFSMGYVTSTIHLKLRNKPYLHPHHKIKMNGYIQSFLNLNRKFN